MRKTRKLLFQKPRDECILRMTEWPVIWRVIERSRKVAGMDALDLAMWKLLVTAVREDVVKRRDRGQVEVI